MPQELTLTIGLPTYNRAKEMQDAIESMVSQLDANIRSRLEILICDDASTDDTPTVSQQYVARYPDVFRYHRNQQNLRYSGNVQQVFVQARGRFVIPFADDDALEPGALARIFKILDHYPDLGVAYLGYTSYDWTLAQRLSPSRYTSPHAEAQVKGRLFASGIESARQAGVLIEALVSTNVIRRDLWLAEDLSPYLDGAIIHMPAAARILTKHSVFLADEPLVKYRSGYGVRWSKVKGYPFNFHFDLLQFWTREHDLYPHDIQRAQHRENVRGVIEALFRAKRNRFPLDRPYFTEQAKATCNTGFWSWRMLVLLTYVPWFFFALIHEPLLFIRKNIRNAQLRRMDRPVS